MKILFVTPYVPSPIRVRPYSFVRELAARHEVSVLATDTPALLEEAEPLRRWCRRVETVPVSRPTAAVSCARAALLHQPLQAAVCQSPALERRLREMLVEERFDVVHVEHLRAARLVDAIPVEVPRLYDAVDCISLLWERTRHSSHSLAQRAIATLELGPTRAFEARVLPLFDRVAVTSPKDARVLQALAPNTAPAVVPNGVDLERFRPCDGPRDPETIVLSGKMSYHANVTAVLYFVREILPRIRRTRPGVRLLIAGSNPPPAIRALARNPSIVATGHVLELGEVVARAAVAVCPVTVKVGIQNKILEAMATAVPVVATRAGAEGIAAEPGRDLLVADDPDQFAGQVCRLLSDDELNRRVGHAGRLYVETHHRWSVVSHRLESLYAEAIYCCGGVAGARSPSLA